MIRFRITLALCLSATLGVARAEEQEPKNLFNGKNLTGWKVDVPQLDKNPNGKVPFVVRDGLLVSLGTPGGQNRDEELLGHVIDTGEEASSPFVRRYRTAGDIAYHCDLADVVGLLCLRTPRAGGS